MSYRMAGIGAGALVLALGGPTWAEGPSGGDGSNVANAALLGPEAQCSYCAPNPPAEAGSPFMFDWSLGLRGGARDTGDGAKYELIALPEVWLRQETERGGYDLGVSGEITRQLEGDLHFGALDLTAGGRYAVDEATGVKGRLDLSLSQDDPDDFDQPTGVATAPVEVSVDAEASVSRDLGAFVVEARGNAGRDVFGETTYTDGSSADNDYQNTTSWGAGVRLGYKLAPGLVAFVDAGADAEQCDAASPTLLAKLDNVTYAVRGGLSHGAGSALELEGSVGLGRSDFGDEALPDFSALLYDGKVTFRPNEALTVSGEVATTISSPGTTSDATAKLEHAVGGDLAYKLNPWVLLRGSVDASTALYEGIDTVETKWGFGAGADYLVNANTDLTADYAFEHSESKAAGASDPSAQQDEHKVSIGLRLHR